MTSSRICPIDLSEMEQIDHDVFVSDYYLPHSREEESRCDVNFKANTDFPWERTMAAEVAAAAVLSNLSALR